MKWFYLLVICLLSIGCSRSTDINSSYKPDLEGNWYQVNQPSVRYSFIPEQVNVNRSNFTGLEVSPQSNRIFTGNFEGNSIRIVFNSGETLQGTIVMGSQPLRMQLVDRELVKE